MCLETGDGLAELERAALAAAGGEIKPQLVKSEESKGDVEMKDPNEISLDSDVEADITELTEEVCNLSPFASLLWLSGCDVL